jgi:hypothetical protein
LESKQKRMVWQGDRAKQLPQNETPTRLVLM